MLQTQADQGILIQNLIFRSQSSPILETVQSTISIKSSPDIFRNGKMKLRCLATLFTLYASSEETEIQEDAPQLALIMVPINQSSGGEFTLYFSFNLQCELKTTKAFSIHFRLLSGRYRVIVNELMLFQGIASKHC